MKKLIIIAAPITLVVTAALIVPVATGTAAATKAGAVPAKLVGVWNRSVTQANYVKYGQGQRGFPVGVWHMVIKQNGAVAFYTPDGYFANCKACLPYFTDHFSTAGARLTAGPSIGIESEDPCDKTRGVYGWSVSGRSLTLKVIADKKCRPREALLTGVWKRK